MATKTKTQFIEPHRKVAEIEHGVLIKLYWQHSSGVDVIDMKHVISVWETIPGWKGRSSEVPFLVERGYCPIVDGVPLDMEKLTKRRGIHRA